MVFYINKITVIFVFVAALFPGVACSDLTESGTESVGKDLANPDQEGWNSKAVFTTRGVVEAELFSRHMMRWNAQKLTTFGQSLRVEFYEKGKHNATLTSDSGEVRGATNNLSAFGNVVIVSDSGLMMRTQKIYWDDQKQLVFADGFVTLTSAEDTLNGYGFESNKDLSNWKMKNAYGQSARDIDLRTGSIRSKNEKNVRKQDDEMDKEMQNVLKENK
ncbi:LPS export ABC transporter periplasmic protein LptC [bacterium]|nr:MAG: LPS export ABC transporter periplasmic protein LptC [bacterium]